MSQVRSRSASTMNGVGYQSGLLRCNMPQNVAVVSPETVEKVLATRSQIPAIIRCGTTILRSPKFCVFCFLLIFDYYIRVEFCHTLSVSDNFSILSERIDTYPAAFQVLYIPTENANVSMLQCRATVLRRQGSDSRGKEVVDQLLPHFRLTANSMCRESNGGQRIKTSSDGPPPSRLSLHSVLGSTHHSFDIQNETTLGRMVGDSSKRRVPNGCQVVHTRCPPPTGARNSDHRKMKPGE